MSDATKRRTLDVGFSPRMDQVQIFATGNFYSLQSSPRLRKEAHTLTLDLEAATSLVKMLNEHISDLAERMSKQRKRSQ